MEDAEDDDDDDDDDIRSQETDAKTLSHQNARWFFYVVEFRYIDWVGDQKEKWM